MLQWIVPVPTWGNHFKVFTFASLSVKTYQCYDPATHGSDFKGLNLPTYSLEDFVSYHF